ncbi:substrate-binding periplasmic protein [Thalassospira australica]|uniref:substrate-binding periplasmic protein n=1 Tax=Thalassospira australica TaxID=1528106 RepID=UPI00051A44C0|nr:transporter substrate-binding domain-containing protein [Thalassospira australica]
MGKWHWPTRYVSHLHVKKCANAIAATLLSAIVQIGAPGIVFAEEPEKSQASRAQNASSGTVFDETYILHLSENPQVRSSARPEPGYFDSLAIELFAQAGLDVQTLPQEPWKRLMELAEREVGHVIYPTTRVENREDLFKWVGPVSRTIWRLYGFSNRGWADMGFDSLLRDARIGVLMGSARESYLRRRGAQQLVTLPREELLLPMMLADRIDLIAVGGNVLRHYIDQAREENLLKGVPDISGVVPYRTCYLYIAISGDVPDRDITQLQSTLDDFKKNGFFVENRRKHGLSTNIDSSFLRAMLNLENNGVSCADLDRAKP